jgi:hypothetical protein
MDHDHFTALGHRVVGQAIADWIQRERLLTAGRRPGTGSAMPGSSGAP